MVNLFFSPYYSPGWFAGLDLVIEVLGIIITFIIAIYSHKIFRIIKEKRFLHFSLAFMFISAAFFVRVVSYALNFFIKPPASIYATQDVVRHIAGMSIFRILGIFIPIILMLAAFMVLIVISTKTKDKKLVSLLFILSFISSFLGVFLHQFWYYLVAFVLLVYVCHSFFMNYKNKKRTTSLIVFVSFSIFAFSQLMFALSAFNITCYVLAEIIQLVSFLMLLIGFILIFKK